MRDYATIFTELTQAMAAYHATPLGTELPKRIKELRKELSTLLSEGAEPCPECKIAPHGMIKRNPTSEDPDPLFEVGCLGCFRRARGAAIVTAVERWNKGLYVPARQKPERQITVTASEG
jgi:hypothetical protein